MNSLNQQKRIELLAETREVISRILGLLDRGRRLVAVRQMVELPVMNEEFLKSMRDRETELRKLRFVEASLVEMVRHP